MSLLAWEHQEMFHVLLLFTAAAVVWITAVIFTLGMEELRQRGTK